MIGMPGVLAVVMGVMALLGEPGSADRIAGTIGAVLFIVMAVGLGPGIGALLSRAKRQPTVVMLINELQRRWGGEVRLPSAFRPILSPRLSTFLNGAPLEAFVQRAQHSGGSFLVSKALETSRAQLGARPIGGSFRANLWLERPNRVRLTIMTRTRISTLGAGLVGLQEVPSGVQRIDESFAVLSDNPRAVHALLADPAIWNEIEAILTLNVPYFGRIDLTRERSIWMTVMTTATNADAFERAALLMQEMGRRLDASS